MTIKGLNGQTFGYLTAVSLHSTNPRKWLCVCKCGTNTIVLQSLLLHGRTKSCGCYRREMGVLRGTASATHGEGMNGKESVEYKTWGAMLSRCNNVNHRMYKYYGAKGIKVCERWHSYQNFLSDMGRRPEGASIDRIDVTRGYEPDNCRWTDDFTQNRNTTRNRYITVNGMKRCISEWCEMLSINRHTLRRLSVEQIESLIKKKLDIISNQEWDLPSPLVRVTKPGFGKASVTTTEGPIAV